MVVALLGCRVMASPMVMDLNVTTIPPWELALDYTVEGAVAYAESPFKVAESEESKRKTTQRSRL